MRKIAGFGGVWLGLVLAWGCTTEIAEGPLPTSTVADGAVVSADGAVVVPLADGATPPPTGDAAVPTTLAPGDANVKLTVAGKERDVLVHAPPQVGSRPLPLVIALHGNGDDNANFVRTSKLLANADTDGYVLVAPRGIVQSITVGRQTVPNVAWDAYRSTSEGNIDLPLFEALRAQYVATGAIDPKKIVVYGYSQGGYASFRWALEASAKISCSIVIGAANPFGGGARIGDMTRKLAFAFQIGSNDSAAANARSTKTALEGAGHPVSFVEVAGAGHSPLPGDARAPLGYCLGQSL